MIIKNTKEHELELKKSGKHIMLTALDRRDWQAICITLTKKQAEKLIHALQIAKG